MFQVPVGGVADIRRTRCKVKRILSDIGLEDCRSFLEDYQAFDPGDEVFQDTEWTDMTEGGFNTRKRKWMYRTKPISCSRCAYQTASWRSYKHHLQRLHEKDMAACAVAPCPFCTFMGVPKALKMHKSLFHPQSKPQPQLPPQPSDASASTGYQVDPMGKYRCLNCPFKSSLSMAVKKHILLAHLTHLNLLAKFARRNPNPLHPQPILYYCKDCNVSLESLDNVLHHVLVTAVHQEVHRHVKPFMAIEKSVFPKSQQPQGLSVPPGNAQQADQGLLLQPGAIQGAPNSGLFIGAAGANRIPLPPQASALVQLASAEAKGLLKPGAAVAFQSAFPPGAVLPGGVEPAMGRLATPSISSTSSQAMGALGQFPQQVRPPNMAPHLIPTGNRVNGLPTYTFASPNMTTSVGKEPTHTVSSPLQPMKSRSNNSKTKRWVACPICNELFPSDVYEVHTEEVHKASPKHECLAAKVPFLKKMPDKTVKCLVCKVLVTKKGLLEHLLHGLDCIMCPSKFNSIRKLVEHYKEHQASPREFSEFVKREYRLHTNGSGKLMFPHFDINTSGPRQMVGNSRINIALVTKSLDLIYVKVLPSNVPQTVCPTPVNSQRTGCLLCDENCQTPQKHEQHLRQKHHVETTIHAITKTAAFRCIYCNGVYTGRVSQKGVAFHLQRCQAAPAAVLKAGPTSTARPVANGRALLPGPRKSYTNGQAVQPVPGDKQTAPLAGLKQFPGISLSKFPQAPPGPVPEPEPPISEEEKLSKLRIEMAWKRAMEANRQEREEKVAKRLKLEQEEARRPDYSIKLALDPAGLENRPNGERKAFLTRYFNKCPHVTKKESDELSKRLQLSKSEVSSFISKKRITCMKAVQKNTIKVMLGFNMSEVNKVQHNLLIPEVASVEPEETTELVQAAESEGTRELVPSAEPAETRELVQAAEPAETTKLVQPADPEETTKLVQSAGPGEMRELVQSTDPKETTNLVHSAGSEETTELVQSEESEETTKLVQSACSEETRELVQSAEPEETRELVQSANQEENTTELVQSSLKPTPPLETPVLPAVSVCPTTHD